MPFEEVTMVLPQKTYCWWPCRYLNTIFEIWSNMEQSWEKDHKKLLAITDRLHVESGFVWCPEQKAIHWRTGPLRSMRGPVQQLGGADWPYMGCSRCNRCCSFRAVIAQTRYTFVQCRPNAMIQAQSTVARVPCLSLQSGTT